MDNVLKKSQIKLLIDNLSKLYGCKLDFLESYYFHVGAREKIYMSKIDVSTLNLEKINSTGIYFGTYHDEEKFRLSIEGSQFVKATQNFITINDETLKSYLASENLFTTEALEINREGHCPFLIVKYKDHNLGCVSIKEEMMLNYIPKSRKLDFNKVF